MPDTTVWHQAASGEVLEQVTLDYLFNIFNELILLPPHKSELLNHLRRIHDSSHREKFDAKAFRAKLLGENKIAPLEAIAKMWNVKKELSANDLKTVVDFIGRHYGEFKISELIDATAGVDLLQSLLEQGKVLMAEERFPNLDIDLNELRINVVPWYQTFLEERLTASEESNYHDAVACQIIQQINSNAVSKNEILVFVSRSTITLDILDRFSTKTQKEGAELSLSRNLDSIAALAGAMAQPNNQTLEKSYVNSFKILLGSFLQRFEDFEISSGDLRVIAPSVDLSDLKKLEEIGNEFNVVTVKIQSLINSGLFRADKSLGKFNFSRMKQNTIMTFLISLLESEDSFVKELDRREEKTKEAIDNLSVNIMQRYEGMKILPLAEYERIADQDSKKLAKTVPIYGIGGELALIVKFQTVRGARLARNLFKRNLVTSTTQVTNAIDYRKIIDTEQSNNHSSDLDLLRAYLEAFLGNLSTAVTILECAITNEQNSNQKLEMLYALVFIHRKKEDTLRGLDICLKALSIDPDEPRLLRELGVLIWQSYNASREEVREEVKRIIGETPDVHLAIRYVTKSLKKRLVKEHQFQCYNSLAYFYAEADEVKSAHNFLKQMLILQKDTDKWPARFHDTRGFVLFKSGLQTNGEQRKKKLFEALAEFERALEIGGIIGRELDTVLKHRFETMIEIARL
jgi:tetratricopeptide (TPR) repeat protein